jgi:glycerol kinase
MRAGGGYNAGKNAILGARAAARQLAGDFVVFVLALDQGTTSSRAIVFDHAGAVVAVSQAEFRQIFPQPGWVEHDPVEIWASQSGVMHAVLAKSGIAARDIVAIGITNQRETTLLWDRATGAPVANAIVWQDRRTAGICDQLRSEGHAPLIAHKTGLVIDAYFSGTKLKWLLDNVPGARVRAMRGELAFGTVDAWLVWQLTGGATHVTDASNASRTMLFDIHRGDWDDELLALLDVPRSVLPRVVASSGVCAEVTLDGARIPVAGIAGDQQAALFGQACHSPGMAKNTYGTGCFMLMNTGQDAVVSTHNLLTTVAWRRDRHSREGGNLASSRANSAASDTGLSYALEGSVFIGGAVVQWLRDGLQVVRSASAIEGLAASVPDTGGVYFVPAFAGLGAPHWDAYARGAILGLTRGSTSAHVARAALESIAYQSADVLRAMQQDSGITLTELRVDGGATANNLLMQFQADVLGVPVVRPRVAETTALGAAYLAGLAVGFWKDEGEVAANWQVERRFEPSMSRERVAELVDGWERAIGRVKSG